MSLTDSVSVYLLLFLLLSLTRNDLIGFLHRVVIFGITVNILIRNITISSISNMCAGFQISAEFVKPSLVCTGDNAFSRVYFYMLKETKLVSDLLLGKSTEIGPKVKNFL